MQTPSTTGADKMNKRYYRAEIADVVANGVTDAERERLLDVFEGVMKRVATCGAREAVFNTTDFANARHWGVAGFALRVKQMQAGDSLAWTGEFSREVQRLEVLGILVDPDDD
jgi:hypothetical protein